MSLAYYERIASDPLIVRDAEAVAVLSIDLQTVD
jgi:hypothetical protein